MQGNGFDTDFVDQHYGPIFEKAKEMEEITTLESADFAAGGLLAAHGPQSLPRPASVKTCLDGADFLECPFCWGPETD
ncbi:hypothetical protein ACFQ36_00710 [Arthrobacter sp. GCM10027362]|uniref:hypothetical protein n=1 Tax=Arthrobacter sp. GCM10027362 TaxID=3273379 RepID=UPI0036343B08